MSNPAQAARTARDAAQQETGHQPLRLHQRCQLTSYGLGEILFVGQTSFSHGIWVGVGLDDALGKNDGVVQGKRYFTTHSGHGIFVRPSQVHVLSDMEERDLLDDEERLFDEQPGGMEEYIPEETVKAPQKNTRPPPVTSTRASISRSGQVLSRSSLASTSRSVSPTKPIARTSRPSSILPPTASSLAGGVRTQAGSPQKRPSLAPKTPARLPGSGPPSIAGGRMSAVGSRTNANSPVKRPASAVASTAARTPATTARIGTTTATARTPATIQRTALAQARSAVQAARAPDAATARAGLRPVAKVRTSMAPPTSASSSPPFDPRTPARTGTTINSRVSQSTVARKTIEQTSSSSTPSSVRAALPSRTPKVTATSSSSRSSRPPTAIGNGDEEEEDLLEMNIEDAVGKEKDQTAGKGTSIDLDDEDDANDDAVPSSPSLQRAGIISQTTDHMSLSGGPLNKTSTARSAIDQTVLQRELEELRAKLRIAERKREEDRETIREAERIQQESEQFLAVKPKMTDKQQELQNELKELHQQEREWNTQKEEQEREMAELTDQVEILSLDKEMAEERAEAALEELQAVKDRVEELQLDIEVLREENARYESGPVEEGEKLSVGYIQLEKQNERLKDALIRLRDLTGESENEHKQKIAELERELRELDEIQASYESTLTKLQEAEAQLEDVKIQLDAAIGAEEMFEQLSERNQELTERVNEMKLVIEDLEALKELNDELEETHIENAKQLQEELDLKEMQLRETSLRSESLEANIAEYENTFGQFRELVLNLQSEVESLRNDEKDRDVNRATAAAEDQAIANLNLKLQSSTLKSQAKTIELEIGRLETSQAKRHLSITSVYLPKKYFENDKDAVESLLFFQRIATKTETIKGVIESNTDIAGSLVGVIDERLISICKMRHSLAHFIASSRQISALIQLASIPTFLKSGRMYKELITIERRIDQFIDLLRREELKEDDCAEDFRRFVKMLVEFEFALLEGSAEAFDIDLAAKELGSATLFDLDLDTIAATLGFSKQAIASLYNDAQKAAAEDAVNSTPLTGGEIDMRLNDLDINEVLFAPLQELINNIRSTKVPSRKLLRRLAALYDNDEAVKMEAIVSLSELGISSSQLVSFASTLATLFHKYVSNVRTNKTSFELKDVLVSVEEAVKDAMSKESTTEEEGGQVSSSLTARALAAWKPSVNQTKKLSQTVSELLNAATEQDNVHKVSGTAPWYGRVEEIQQEQNDSAESQRIILKQTEDLRDLYKQIKVRDEVIEENRIKIERIAKQLQRSRQDNETVTTLRDDLVDVTRRMKAYEEGNSALQTELEQLQIQYERAINDGGARGNSNAALPDGSNAQSTNAPMITPSGFLNANLPSSGNYEVSYLVDQIEALRGANRYLRLENGLIKGRDLFNQFDQLHSLAVPIRTTDEVQDEPIEEEESKGGVENGSLGMPRSKKEGRMENLGLGKPRRAIVKAGKSTFMDVRKQAENKRLVQDWIQMASSPRVIKLPAVSKDLSTSETNHRTKKAWIPLAQMPQVQFDEMVRQRKRLRERIENLQNNSNRGMVTKPIRT